MSTPVIITSLISLIPAVILTICIFWLDRLEREPLTLLLRLLLTGAVFYFGAYYLRVQIVRAIDRVMAGQMEFNLTGVVSFDAPAARFLNQALNSWGAVALIDVLAIWLVLRIFVVNLPDYDCFFDGIVYGAVTALGFAVSSCLFYALRFGMDTLVLRALVTGPSIIMTGVFTGLFFSLGKQGCRIFRKAFSLKLLRLPFLNELPVRFINGGNQFLPFGMQGKVDLFRGCLRVGGEK